MAKLISEDTECISSIELVAGAAAEVEGQTWQRYAIVLNSGSYHFELGTDKLAVAPKQLQVSKSLPEARAASQLSGAECYLCRTPHDEAADLIGLLESVVAGKKDELRFEPSEPSFELLISRSGASGFKAEIWIDSGNATTGIYRWDGAGVRLFTLAGSLSDFTKALAAEFANQPQC